MDARETYHFQNMLSFQNTLQKTRTENNKNYGFADLFFMRGSLTAAILLNEGFMDLQSRDLKNSILTTISTLNYDYSRGRGGVDKIGNVRENLK